MWEEVTGIHWRIDGRHGQTEDEKAFMRRKYEKAKDEKTQMRMKYEKTEEMKRRRRSRGEDGCGKK